MTKEFSYSILILLTVLLALLLRHPLAFAIDSFSANTIRTELLSGVITRFLIGCGLFYFMRTKGFLAFNGFAPAFTLTRPSLLIIPIFITALLALTNLETFRQAKPSMLLLFGCNAALTAILEELTIRGTILPLMLKHFSKKKKPFLKAVVASSLLFGLAHFIALVRQPENFSGILTQVIIAIGIGFFLAALLFATQNVAAPIIVHFLTNFSGGAYRLKAVAPKSIPSSEGMGFVDYLPVLAISLTLAFVGLHTLRRIEKDRWLKKISLIKI